MRLLMNDQFRRARFMLQWIRDKSQGAIALVIVVVLCLAFGLWGIHNYMGNSQHKKTAANVNGHEITQRQLAQAFSHFRAQNMQKHPEWFNSQTAVKQSQQKVLKHLVDRYLLVQAARQYGFSVGDNLLQQALINVPAFQQDGSFSKQRFERFLGHMQMSQPGFLNMLREQILQNQVRAGIVGSAFVTPFDLTTAQELIKQKRSLYYSIIPHKPLVSLSSVTRQQMRHYYKHHQKAYKVAKQVKLAYIKMSKEHFHHTINPSQKELKHYYDQHLDQFAKPETWHVSYLQLPNNNASEKAHKLYQKWQDGSKPKTLADNNAHVSFHTNKVVQATNKQPTNWQQALKGHHQQGQVVHPFQDNSNYIIAKITNYQPETAPSFDAIKDQVKQAYIKQQASEQFSEKVNDLANLTFEHSTSLEPAAQQLNLSINTTPYLKEGVKDFDKGLLQYKKVRQAAFSDEVLKNHNNSEVINLDQDTVVVVRAQDIKPEHTKPFEQVEASIKHQVAQQKATQLAHQIAQKWQNQISVNQSLKALAQHDKTLTTKVLNNVNRGQQDSQQKTVIVNRAFQLMRPTDKQTSTAVHTLANGDVVLIQLESVKQPSVDADDVSQQQRHIMQRGYGALEYKLYRDAVRQQADIDYKT